MRGCCGGSSNGCGCCTPTNPECTCTWEGAGATGAVDTGQVTLLKLPLAATRTIRRDVLEDLPGVHVEAFMQDTWDGLQMEIRGWVLAEHVHTEYVPVTWDTCRYYPFPATWWQHLKQSLPGWIRRRLRPVQTAYHEIGFQKTEYVKVEQLATFPMSPLQVPEHYRGREVFQFSRAEQA